MLRRIATAIALVSLTVVSPTVHAGQTSRAGSTPKTVLVTPININTAASADLAKLPGIGARTADRIIEYRQKNGPFKKIEELMNVRGVGEKSFLRLKDHISVGSLKTDRVASQQQ